MQPLATEALACLHIVCQPLNEADKIRCIAALDDASAVVLLPNSAEQAMSLQNAIGDAQLYVVRNDEPEPNYEQQTKLQHISYAQLVDLTAKYPVSRSW